MADAQPYPILARPILARPILASPILASPILASPILAIDLTRFACAMLVLAYHYGAAFWSAPEGRVTTALHGVAAIAPVLPMLRAGVVGVELFFVISGLVIARSAASAGWRDFLARRALRLVPAAWICASITAIVLLASGAGDAALAGDWFRSMRFWPVGTQVDGSYWTLGVEGAFYLLVAAAGTGSPRRILAIGWALGLASALFWAACLALGDRAGALVTNQGAILLLLPHGCFFATGIAIAARGARGSKALVVLGTATGLVEIAAHVDGWRPSAALGVAEILFGIGLAALLLAPAMQAWLARRIGPHAARSIGAMTYPLYLLHQTAGAATIGALARHGIPTGWAIVLTTVAMLASAWIVARRAEPAMRAAIVTLFSRRRGPPRDSRPIAFPPAG